MEREIGISQQRIGFDAIVRCVRDTHARADVDPGAERARSGDDACNDDGGIDRQQPADVGQNRVIRQSRG